MRIYRPMAIGAFVLLSSIAGAVGRAAAAGPLPPPTIAGSSLMNGGMPCSTAKAHPIVLGYFATELAAVGRDRNPPYTSGFDYTFQVWPVSDPAAVTTVDYEAFSPGALGRGHLADGVLTSGDSYRWRVQVADDNGTSAWSKTCTFTYDATAPSMPSVSSDNYPADGVGALGEPARFTFSGHGDHDIAGFEYGWGDLPVPVCSYSGPLGQLVCPDPLAAPDVVRADAPGGTAAVVLNPPDAGPQRLYVAALDRAGNRSSTITYETFVPFSGPAARAANSGPVCGNVMRAVFSPHPGVTGVVAYRYSYPNGTTKTVAADAHGHARVTLRFTGSFLFLEVRSVSANGFVSSAGQLFADTNLHADVQSDAYPNDGQPHGGVGVPGTFTFAPPPNGVGTAAYRYQFNGGPSQTVAADPSSNVASVEFTPTAPGSQTLTVVAMADDGSGDSCAASYDFVVGG